MYHEFRSSWPEVVKIRERERPFLSGALQDAFARSTSSPILLIASDLEANPTQLESKADNNLMRKACCQMLNLKSSWKLNGPLERLIVASIGLYLMSLLALQAIHLKPAIPWALVVVLGIVGVPSGMMLYFYSQKSRRIATDIFVAMGIVVSFQYWWLLMLLALPFSFSFVLNTKQICS